MIVSPRVLWCNKNRFINFDHTNILDMHEIHKGCNIYLYISIENKEKKIKSYAKLWFQRIYALTKSSAKKTRKNKLRWCWILSSRCGDRAFRSHSPAGSRKWTPRLPVTSVGSTLNSTTGTPFDATSGAKRHAWTTSEDKLPQSIDHSHLVFVVLYKKLYHLGSLWTKLYRVEEIQHNCKWFTVEVFFSGKRASSANRSGDIYPPQLHSLDSRS